MNNNYNFKKIFTIMKVVVIFLWMATLSIWASDVNSQNAVIHIADYQDITIEKFIQEVESQTNYLFVYSKNDINTDAHVSMPDQETSVKNALDLIASNAQLAYRFDNDYIVLVKRGLTFPDLTMQPMQQGIAITGQVTDAFGDPLPGVSVMVKGTTQGTATDGKGAFSLSVQDGGATLSFSYVGFVTQEIIVGDKRVINVTLIEDTRQIEEVVVVGYGVQKKVNLTGSVESVRSADIGKRTVTQASNLLQGKASGISVRQTSGDPANNSASILIRGRGTFSDAGTNPLVLVDGIESSINNVHPNDIESISILKDAASAAIYGSKAANGVILVTTKKGAAGKLTVSYNGLFGKQTPTFLPEMVNSWEYAEIVNEALINGGGARRYSDEDIQKFRSGTDPNYPNYDHIGNFFGSGSGLQNMHDIGMRGGNETTQFLFSLGYFDQEGIVKKNYANKYNFRLNVNSQLRKNLQFSAKISGHKYEHKLPVAYDGSYEQLVHGVLRNSAVIPGRMENGNYGRVEVHHPEADLDSKNFSKYGSSYLYGNADLAWEIIPDLKITGQAGYTFGINEDRNFVATYPVIAGVYEINVNSLGNSWDKNNALTLQSMIEYTKTFGSHYFYILGGISSRSTNYNDIYAYRNQFPNNEITQIDAGATVQAQNAGSASATRLASYFGRLNYNFKERYLFEANFRYDGTSRLPADNRWGFFPSASVAWRLSEEDFFKNNVSFIDNLKFRFSVGKLGNQAIGDYPYQSLLSTGENYAYANTPAAGVAVTTVPNVLIMWESTNITDVGLDVGLLSNKLSLTFDYYKKYTYDILYGVSVSSMLGAGTGASNAGEVQNNGFDVSVAYRNKIQDFSFDVSGVFSYNRNKVTKIAHLDRDINAGLFVGYPIGSAYGFKSDGLFVDDADVSRAPSQPFGNIAMPGGIKLRDISGPNGVPDGIVDSSYDRDIIGMPLPITTYGLSFNGEYKNFDFNLFFQGEGGRVEQPSVEFFYPLNNNGNVQRDYYNNRWTRENPDPKAMYPTPWFVTTLFYTSNKMEFWYRSATFLRLKNVQIGYTLPQQLSGKVAMSKARIFVTGENLFTIHNYYKGWDPEASASSSFYPLLRLLAVGINVEF